MAFALWFNIFSSQELSYGSSEDWHEQYPAFFTIKNVLTLPHRLETRLLRFKAQLFHLKSHTIGQVTQLLPASILHL